MKNIFYILLLLPTIIFAQYQGNGNQKITLGEQTSADGLVYRGLASDTTRKPSVDTMAYILLDTNTNIIWQYKKVTNNAWTRVGGSISSGLTGVLPVANGGTNTSTEFAAGSVVFAGASGTYTQNNTNLFWDNASSRLGIGTNALLTNRKLTLSGTTTSIMRMEATSNNGEPSFELLGKNSSGVTRSFTFKYDNSELFRLGSPQNVPMRFETNDISRLYIKGTGEVGIGIDAPTEKLHVVGNVRISAMNGINDIGASATGVLQAATSDMNLKNTIENSPFGLNEILLLNPVTFLYNDENRKIDSDVKEVGFIAQDVFDIIPNAVSSTGTGDLQLDYRAITAALVKAIQEQQALIKALEKRILILENK